MKTAEQPAVCSSADVAGKPHHRRAGIGEEHGILRSQMAKRSCEEFWPDRFDPRTFLDVIIQQPVKFSCLRDTVVEETAIVLRTHLGQQLTQGGLNIAHHCQIYRRAAANMVRPEVDLHFLHLVPRQKFLGSVAWDVRIQGEVSNFPKNSGQRSIRYC